MDVDRMGRFYLDPPATETRIHHDDHRVLAPGGVVVPAVDDRGWFDQRGRHEGEPEGPLMAAWEWLGSIKGFRLVQVVMLVTVVMVGYLVYAQQHTVSCNRAYNERQAEVSASRAEASNKDWAALDDLIAKTREGGQAYQKAADDYLATRAETLKQREQNPVVPPPSSYCGA
jgi:hypothetical protein